jgi:uncharacterized membrane protein
MIHIPTWIDMFLLVLTFVLTGLQYRLEDNERSPVLSFRFGLLVLCVVAMTLAVFLNSGADWTSIGLFLASLGGLVVTVLMFWLMPARKPNN